LTKERAIAMQTELLRCYGAPEFQQELKALQTKCGAHSKDCAAGRRRLVREAQVKVLPAHGYDASDSGVRQMLADFDRFLKDPEVEAMSHALDDALGCDSRGGLSLESVVCLLRDVFTAFGADEFQSTIIKVRGEFVDGDKDEEFVLCGPSRAILDAQRPVLSKYGFPANRLGAKAMLSEVAKYAKQPEVAGLIDAANGRLGLSPAACVRFREKLSGKAAGVKRKQAPGGAADDLTERLIVILGAPADLQVAPAHEPAYERRAVVIAQREAAAILSDLLKEVSTADFQQKLQAVIDDAIVDGRGNLANIPGRQDLAMHARNRVLRFRGFKGADAGVAHLVEALRPLMTDPSLATLVLAIERKLCIPRVADSSAVDKPAPACGRPEASTAADTEQVLQELLDRYFSPRFQEKLQSICSDDAVIVQGDFRRLMLSLHVDVLPKYGFQATGAGVKKFRATFEAVRSAPDVAALITQAEALIYGQVPTLADLLAAKKAHASQQAKPPVRQPKPLTLSKGRAAAIFTDLDSRLSCRSVKEKPQQIQQAMREVLPMHGVEANTEGLRRLWEVAQPLLDDDSRVRAERLVDGVFGKLTMKVEHESIPLDAGLEVHEALLTRLSAPGVQKGLSELFRKHSPSEAEFSEPFARLTNPLLDAAFTQRGLPAPSQDLTGAMVALGDFYAKPGAQAVVSALDEAMFGAERLSDERGPSLQAVVGVLRAQLAAFSTGEFQASLQELQKAAAWSGHVGDFFNAPGGEKLAAQMLKEALPRFGFGDAQKGVKSLNALSLEYQHVPQVAALRDAVNVKFGAEPASPHKQAFKVIAVMAGA